MHIDMEVWGGTLCQIEERPSYWSQSVPLRPKLLFMSKAPDPLCSQKVWRKMALVKYMGKLMET